MFKNQEYAAKLEAAQIKEDIPKGKCYINIHNYTFIKNKIVFENADDKKNWVLINDSDIKEFIKSKLIEKKELKDKTQ